MDNWVAGDEALYQSDSDEYAGIADRMIRVTVVKILPKRIRVVDDTGQVFFTGPNRLKRIDITKNQ